MFLTTSNAPPGLMAGDHPCSSEPIEVILII